MAQTHEFDWLSNFCTRCGAAKTQAVDGIRPTCTEASNVTGIAHLIAAKHMDAVLQPILRRLDLLR